MHKVNKQYIYTLYICYLQTIYRNQINYKELHKKGFELHQIKFVLRLFDENKDKDLLDDRFLFQRRLAKYYFLDN